MMNEVLAVEPGESFGPFRLGMSIGEVLALVQKHAMAMPHISLTFDEEDPCGSDISVRLRGFGVRLRFSSVSQRLKQIDVMFVLPVALEQSSRSSSVPLTAASQLERLATPSRKLSMQYQDFVFGSPTDLKTIYRVFGPTYAGQWDRARRMYVLQYPGLCVLAHLANNSSSSTSSSGGRADANSNKSNNKSSNKSSNNISNNISNSGNESNDDIPLELEDGTSPPITRLCIHPHRSVRISEVNDAAAAGRNVHSKLKLELPPLPPSFHSPPNEVYFEPVQALPGKGVYFVYRNKWVAFGDYVQDVVLALGPPAAVFDKRIDKLEIHNRGHHHHSGDGSDDGGDAHAVKTIYNYFLLGVDVVFVRHRVNKIVMHANRVARPDFNVYRKCNFHIVAPTQSADSDATQPAAALSHAEERKSDAEDDRGDEDDVKVPPAEQHKKQSRKNKKKKKRKKSSNKKRSIVLTTEQSAEDADNKAKEKKQKPLRLIGPDERWETIAELFGVQGKPIVYASSSSAHHMDSNPFGSSSLYASEGIVFEVLKNGYLASITLFHTPSHE